MLWFVILYMHLLGVCCLVVINRSVDIAIYLWVCLRILRRAPDDPPQHYSRFDT